MDPDSHKRRRGEFDSMDSLLQPSCTVIVKRKRKRPITTTTTSINDLPDCVLMEILAPLSLPTVVLHCKWVSKRWFSLISTPCFARRFITLHPHVHHPFSLIFYYPDCHINRRLLVTTNSESESESESELKSLAAYLHNKCDPNTSSLQACCNDLLLCRVKRVQQHCPPINMVSYSIINPISRQCLALPPRLVPPFPPHGFLDIRLGIICSYDYNNDKQVQLSSSFRVVLIPWSRTKFTTKFKVHIFSSDTGEWSDSVVLCPPNLYGFNFSIIALPTIPYKGFLFWSIDGGHLLGFDPYNSASCVIEKPVQLEQGRNLDCLGLCHGCLRTSQVSGSPHCNEHPCLRIWDLVGFDNNNNNNGGGAGAGTGGKWCLKHELYFNQMVSEKSPWLTQYVTTMFPSVSVLAFHPNDANVVYLMIQSKVVFCNLQSRTLEVFCHVPQREHAHYFTYHPLSFVLPSWPTPIPSVRDAIADYPQ